MWISIFSENRLELTRAGFSVKSALLGAVYRDKILIENSFRWWVGYIRAGEQSCGSATRGGQWQSSARPRLLSRTRLPNRVPNIAKIRGRGQSPARAYGFWGRFE